MVWYGMVQYSMVWYGVVWYCMVMFLFGIGAYERWVVSTDGCVGHLPVVDSALEGGCVVTIMMTEL